MLLSNRRAWNVQRLYWFLWRDPAQRPEASGCSFCGSAGLLRNNRTKKPAYSAFRSFAAETTPPQASITGGPAQGGFTKDPTPSFSFAAVGPTDAGSTFVCRVDAGAYKPCSSPYTTPALSNGSHFFYVRAIDAPGNESQIVWRTFTVDTQRAADDDHGRSRRARPPTPPPRSASRPASRARPSGVGSTPSRSPPARGQRKPHALHPAL